MKSNSWQMLYSSELERLASIPQLEQSNRKFLAGRLCNDIIPTINAETQQQWQRLLADRLWQHRFSQPTRDMNAGAGTDSHRLASTVSICSSISPAQPRQQVTSKLCCCCNIYSTSAAATAATTTASRHNASAGISAVDCVLEHLSVHRQHDAAAVNTLLVNTLLANNHWQNDYASVSYSCRKANGACALLSTLCTVQWNRLSQIFGHIPIWELFYSKRRPVNTLLSPAAPHTEDVLLVLHCCTTNILSCWSCKLTTPRNGSTD